MRGRYRPAERIGNLLGLSGWGVRARVVRSDRVVRHGHLLGHVIPAGAIIATTAGTACRAGHAGDRRGFIDGREIVHRVVHVRRAGERVCSIGDDLGDCKGACGVEIAQGSLIDGLWGAVEEKIHAAGGRGVRRGGVCVTEGGLHVVSGVVDEDWRGGGGGGGGGESLVLNPKGRSDEFLEEREKATSEDCEEQDYLPS